MFKTVFFYNQYPENINKSNKSIYTLKSGGSSSGLQWALFTPPSPPPPSLMVPPSRFIPQFLFAKTELHKYNVANSADAKYTIQKQCNVYYILYIIYIIYTMLKL